MKTLDVKIRATNPGQDQGLKSACRIFISKDALIELTGSVEDGKAVTVVELTEDGREMSSPREALLWAAPTKLVKVVQMSEAFRLACGFSIGSEVRICFSPGAASVTEAEEIVIEATMPSKDGSVKELDPDSVAGWEWFLGRHLVHVETVFPGLVLKKLPGPGPMPLFTVRNVNGSYTGLGRYSDKRTVVKIARPGDVGVEATEPGKLEIENVPGREEQVKELNRFLARFTKPNPYDAQPNFSGLVVHGGHGTGKSMLLDLVAKTGWGTVHRIHFKDKLPEVQETLTRARNQQPSIVLIDALERLIDIERSNRTAVILALCEALDALSADAAAKCELPKVVVIATCLDHVTDVPADLRDPGRFTRDIFLPLPDETCRKAILTSFNLPLDPDTKATTLQDLSERTHAYNGKDLRLLAEEAKYIAFTSLLDAQQQQPPTNSLESQLQSLTLNKLDFNFNSTPAAPNSTFTSYLSPTHLSQARKKIRPSAMHDVNLKPPPIHWTDIGGQGSVKASLRLAVSLSRMSPADVASLIGTPPKGFLLYGPPGCSKTMAAQAMATESGLNFFAVKGAELLNMYVGESERAVRRLFERAREVSPSMIFFDEIDSIAGQRHGFGGGPATTGASHGGLNVLTTLLNEMDGFETMQGVLVLAATNRPQALDPALLRPGRFDELIYVGPPDLEARTAILKAMKSKRRLAEDVDVAALAEDTDGYSGAEIVGICRSAGRVALMKGLDAGAEVSGVHITMDDFRAAIDKMPKQITREMLQGYADWEKKFRRL
ncbi:AAA-domain-containing protein [Coniochaeta ligniaria NRRL 30616]|uniref:AAA-domain-containing protein n=1 Tax=Coniochaeta ligniaria NRRL 30616 TaxID=1408157 RepID=A0A1J7IYN3_9PEZI|nr:AAA-domain-containing protein [Coniochaeta ligniaria NRRL 30616]